MKPRTIARFHTQLDEELSAIRERWRAASAGPWRLDKSEFADWGRVKNQDDYPIANACVQWILSRWEEAGGRSNDPDQLGPPQIRANAQFIAHAWEDIRFLVQAVERLCQILETQYDNVDLQDEIIARLESAHGKADDITPMIPAPDDEARLPDD